MGMSSKHGRLYEAAERAIDDIFGNTRVSKQTTKDQLEALRDRIDMLADSIKVDDMEPEEGDEDGLDPEEDIDDED
jgi:hypothetical protein